MLEQKLSTKQEQAERIEVSTVMDVTTVVISNAIAYTRMAVIFTVFVVRDAIVSVLTATSWLRIIRLTRSTFTYQSNLLTIKRQPLIRLPFCMSISIFRST